jgi:hypothetical protein
MNYSIDILGLLNSFASDLLFSQKFALAFGQSVTPEAYLSALATLPAIEIRSDAELQGALGAFSAQTGKIYLSQSLVQGSPSQYQATVIEEIGHYLDVYFNGNNDSDGDEGDIFSRLVRGETIDQTTLQALKAENDHATITLDGQQIEIEQMFAAGDLTAAQGFLATQDAKNNFLYENVLNINSQFRARFKNVTINNVPNTPYTAIPHSDSSPGATYGGLNTTGNTVITPLPSTVKGLLAHTSTPTGPANCLNASLFANTLGSALSTGTNFLLAEDTYNGSAINVGILRYSGTGPVKVTLDWTGSANNNLDLWLTKSLDGPVETPVLTQLTETTGQNDNIEQYAVPQGALAGGNYYIYVGNQRGVYTPNPSPFIQDFSIFATAPTPSVGGGHGWGDVHLVTFDQKPYDFQAVGEFILVKSLIDDFQVQTRQEPWGGSTSVSINTAFATTIDGFNIVYDRDLPAGQKLSIDGIAYNLLSGQSIDFISSRITRQGDRYTLIYAGPDGDIATSADNDVVTADDYGSYMNVYVDPADYRIGTLQGLLGNGDADQTNDFALRNGTVLSNPTVQTLHTTFADSWRITQGESLFGTPTFSNPNFPTQYINLDTLRQQNPQAVANATALARAAGIPEGTFLEGAVLDFVVTGDIAFINGAAASFAQSVSLAVSPSQVTEDGANNLVYTFTRTGNTDFSVAVDYQIGGTATLDTDYTINGASGLSGNTGTITFASGETIKQLVGLKQEMDRN